MANNLLKSLMKAYGQYSAFTNQDTLRNPNPGPTIPRPRPNPNPNPKPTPGPYIPKPFPKPGPYKPVPKNPNPFPRGPRPNPGPTIPRPKPIPGEPGLKPKPTPMPQRMANATPNYMTQYNNSINPKANTKVAYAAEPMQSRINNQYYATRNNGAFNENGFQQFMQQAQQQPQQQQQPQYAQPQPVTNPNIIAQPQPVEEPTMFPQPQPVEDNRLSRPMFGGTAKRMSSVKKSSKKPTIMKTYEYSPQRMHEGTGKPPKMPSTNRTIYSTKKFY